MHLVITGLNAWSLVFLTVALGGGYSMASWHVRWALLASITALMSQSAVFALFIGAAKTLKETVGLYKLPSSFIDRTNAIYFRLFPWATAAAGLSVAAAVLGGLVRGSPLVRRVHGLLSLVMVAVHIAATVMEYRQLRVMHFLLREMAAAVPPEEERALESGGAAPPGASARETEASAARFRGRALLTLCTLAMATLLGYRYVMEVDLPDPILIGASALLAAGMAFGAYLWARGGGKSGA